MRSSWCSFFLVAVISTWGCKAQDDGNEFLPPVLSILASECRVTIESPIDIPAAPEAATGGDLFEIPVDIIVRFTAHQDVTMVHAHWGPPDFTTSNPPTITGYEVKVNQSLDGVVSPVSVTPALADDNSAHVAGNATFGSTIITSVTTIYEDENGNEVRSEEAVFPHSNTLCCPLMHPAPKFLPQPLDRADFVNEIDGGDYFVSVGGNLWTYFCHDGVYKSCFITPDGFEDPRDNRFQEVGEVAVFVDEVDGSEVEFVCVLRETGNADADDRSDDLSGAYVRVPTSGPDDIVEDVVVDDSIPPPTRTGVMASESRVFDGNKVELDPTLHFIDAAHEVGTQPYTIPPAEVVRVQGKNEANRFHSHWEIPTLPEDSPFTLTGFEITAVQQDGTVLSTAQVGPDIFDIHILINGTDHDPFSVDPPKFIAPSGQTIVASVTVLYDSSNGPVRSEPATFPASNSDACGCNFPPPKVLPAEFESQESEGETDGGFFTVFNKGNQWTYFCNNGIYKSCFHPPKGFSDPLGQRFQEIGGQAVFFDDTTGELVSFVCMFSPTGDNPVPLDDIDGELSGRFVKSTLRDVMNTDAIAASSSNSNEKALLATTIIFVVLSVILLILLIYTCLKRRQEVAKAANSEPSGQSVRKGSEMAKTSYSRMSETAAD